MVSKLDRLFDNADISLIPDREFRVLNALDVSIYRCLEKYEVIFQIIAQNKTDMNRSLVMLTWELVDWFERTRKILNLGTGFKKKELAFQKISRSLKKAEELRHVVQHFDNFIKRSMNNDFAPLGAVSAIQVFDDGSFKTSVYNAGIVREKTNMGSVQLPEKIYDKVDYVTLTIDSKEVNLSELSRNLLEFYSLLREKISKKYPKS